MAVAWASRHILTYVQATKPPWAVQGIRQGPHSAAQLCRWAKCPAFAENVIWLDLGLSGLLLPLQFVISLLSDTGVPHGPLTQSKAAIELTHSSQYKLRLRHDASGAVLDANIHEQINNR